MRRAFFALLLTLASLFGAAQNVSAQWTPPIGIPAPPFGINETAPAAPSPWTAATPGFYYVDQTQASATDTLNAYGTPAKPRRSIPSPVPAGAVVEIHGTYDNGQASPNGVYSLGTVSNPAYIRGASASAKPLIRRGWEVSGSYLVMENLSFSPLSATETGYVVIRAPADHVAVRHSEVTGIPSGGGLGVVSWDGASVAQYIVLWDNNIHNNGDLSSTYDQDVHGIAVSDHVAYLWVVDNKLSGNSGDGIQINAGPTYQATTHHIYVGRNEAFGNRQSGFWTKQAVDVIFSQNLCHDHWPNAASGTPGDCLGSQYAAENVWFIYNHIHHSEIGIFIASDDTGQGFGTHIYAIGNVIHNIHTSDPAGYNPYTGWAGGAVLMSGGINRVVVGNTIWDVDAGVNIPPGPGQVEIGDNIIGNVTVSASNHVFVESSAMAALSSFHHNLLYGTPRMRWGGSQMFPTPTQLAGSNSLSADPQLVNPAGEDLHIQPSSAAIDKGETNAVYATFQRIYGISIQVDADNKPRPVLAAMDIGAYESGASSPTVTALTANVPLPSAAGKTITWTAQASGGTGDLEYQWWLSSAGIGWTLVQDYSASNTMSLTPAVPDIGDHMLQVWVRVVGSTKSYDAWQGVSFSITSPPPLQVRLLPAATPATSYGTTLQWTASSAGGIGPVQYQWWRYDDASAAWRLARDWSTNGVLAWTPGLADVGVHAIQVWARSAGSTASYEAWSSTGYFTVLGPAPLTFTLTPATLMSSPYGVPLQWSVSTSGGLAPAQFQWWRFDASSGAWSLARDWSTSATLAWTPGLSDVGVHAFQVWARNAGSTAPHDAVISTGSFTVSGPAPLSVTVSPNSVTSIPFGTPMQWTSIATGGVGPVQFQWWRFDDATGTWTLARDWTTSTTFSWTPSTSDTGGHSFQVWGRNNGSTNAHDAYAGTGHFIVAAPPPPTIIGLVPNVGLPARVGTTITWTATAAGGLGPLQYEFWRQDGTTWVLAQSWGTSRTYTWTTAPGNAGSHSIQVWARNAGSNALYDAWLGTSAFTITP